MVIQKKIFEKTDGEKYKFELFFNKIDKVNLMRSYFFEFIPKDVDKFFCLTKFRKILSNSKNFIRIVGLLAAICWLVYGIICGSVAGTFFEIVIIISTIASYIKGRTAIQCSARYKRIKPGIKKGYWTKDEDIKLKHLYKILGKNGVKYQN